MGLNLETDVLEARIANAFDELVLMPPNPDVPADRKWEVSDHQSLEAAVDLEQWIETEGISYVSGPIQEHLSDWRATLPFTTPERTRLVELRRQLDTDPFGFVKRRNFGYLVVQHVDLELVDDAGMRFEISGERMAKNWYDWRRALGGRFEDSRGVQRAAHSLELARLIAAKEAGR